MNLKMMLTHEANMALFEGNKERGWPSPRVFSGEEAQTKWSLSSPKTHKIGAKEGLRGGKQPQTKK